MIFVVSVDMGSTELGGASKNYASCLGLKLLNFDLAHLHQSMKTVSSGFVQVPVLDWMMTGTIS